MTALALPDIDTARLPVVYEAALTALAECSRIDECQSWANKAEAMASYAKQAKDDSMRKMADRIQARAIRRCGELLKQIEPAKGTRTDIQHNTGDYNKLTRQQAAADAGLSNYQRVTALRVANVPEIEFNEAVESENPPTVTKLAEVGTQKRKPLVDLGDIPPADYARATEAQGMLRRYAAFCEKYDPVKIAKAYKPHEVAALRQYFATMDSWNDRFITNLPE